MKTSLIAKFFAAAAVVSAGYGLGYTLDNRTPSNMLNCVSNEGPGFLESLRERKVCVPKLDLYFTAS